MKKKLILSLFIVISFVGYAIAQSVNKLGRLFREDDEPRINQQPTADRSVALATPTPAAPTNNNPASASQPAAPTPPANQPSQAPTAPTARSGYRDGSYVGDAIDVYYGYVQVKAVISAGKIIDVQFLDYPQDRDTSRQIAAMSLPVLRSEAISVQSAQVDMVSGATETSTGFIKSLQSALAKAQG